MSDVDHNLYPWACFQPNLTAASHKLWMLLGQARAKCEYIAGVPLKPAVAQCLNQLYLTKGVLATTAIEGNTLTEDEVLDYLSKKRSLPLSKEYLGIEIDNIVSACNSIVNDELNQDISVETLKSYNRRVLERLPSEEHVIAGEIRSCSVTVGGYRPPPWDTCNQLLSEFCEWLKLLEDQSEGDQDSQVEMAIVRAILAHLHFVWIHPFADGNGRTARLLEFRILVGTGIPVPAVHLLSNHYNTTRAEYYRQLDEASKTGDCNNFLFYAVQGFIDQLNEQLTVIRGQQINIAWKDFVYDSFSGATSSTDLRRRSLVLDLSAHYKPVPKNLIRHVSPRIAESYAGKTEKTISRDLNELIGLNLIKETPLGYLANQEIILAFLPLTKAPLLLNQVPMPVLKDMLSPM